MAAHSVETLLSAAANSAPNGSSVGPSNNGATYHSADDLQTNDRRASRDATRYRDALLYADRRASRDAIRDRDALRSARAQIAGAFRGRGTAAHASRIGLTQS